MPTLLDFSFVHNNIKRESPICKLDIENGQFSCWTDSPKGMEIWNPISIPHRVTDCCYSRHYTEMSWRTFCIKESAGPDGCWSASCSHHRGWYSRCWNERAERNCWRKTDHIGYSTGHPETLGFLPQWNFHVYRPGWLIPINSAHRIRKTGARRQHQGWSEDRGRQTLHARIMNWHIKTTLVWQNIHTIRSLADSTIEKCGLHGFICGQTAHLLGLNCNLAGIICFKNKLTLLQPHELTGDPVTVVKDNFIGGSHVGNHCHRKKDPDK